MHINAGNMTVLRDILPCILKSIQERSDCYGIHDHLVNGHIEVYDANGEFWFSADTRAEVREELMQIA